MTLPSPAPDRTALVTGASGGIGAEIALDLAKRGHRVSLVARSEDKLEAVADQIRKAGGTADVLPTDLIDRTARAELPERITELGATVDILVNNAGLTTMGRVVEAEVADELTMTELNVNAVVDLCVRFVPGMVERKRGAVLNVASVGGFQPLPGQAGYGAGKAFVVSYTQSLAGELAKTPVTVTALCPGPVDTEFGASAGFSMEEAKKMLPEAMWVSPEDVAKTGVAGLDKGKLVVIPGLANRASVALTHFAPTSVLLPVLAKSHPAMR